MAQQTEQMVWSVTTNADGHSDFVLFSKQAKANAYAMELTLAKLEDGCKLIKKEGNKINYTITLTHHKDRKRKIIEIKVWKIRLR